MGVRVAATGHSFNPFACPADSSGAVVDIRGFRELEVIKLPDGRHAVSAQAGITMGQLQNLILAQGLTLRVPPGNSAYTLGGCLATGCHNLGQGHAEDLLSITFVLHDGSVREVLRGDSDFNAAAVSLGRLGVILSATLEVLPYRALHWSSEELPMPAELPWETLKEMASKQTSKETIGNKLVFYFASKVFMVEHWTATGRVTTVGPSEPLDPYVNRQPFRLGQGTFSDFLARARKGVFSLVPLWVLQRVQAPAEHAFRSLHSSAEMAKVRQALGWQHSPESRGDGADRPKGNQWTWAGWLDEVVNLFMGLRHVEVIFPLHPREQAIKCFDVVFAHQHLAWWRLNIRTMPSDEFFVSSTHSPASNRTTFLRVDFVAPGGLLEIDSGEASLTEQLHRHCPGWRKHWGKGLWKTSSDEKWGDAAAFLEVVRRWDPKSKFQPQDSPAWLSP